MSDGWLSMSVTPNQLMPVLFFLGNAKFYDHQDNEIAADDLRAERLHLGFWDGDWRWAGTSHRVFEFDLSEEWLPTKWRALSAPPTEAS